MGRKLAIAREAIRDLDEIWDYIAADSIANADRFIERIYEKCREISELDGIGRKREDLHPGMLSVPFKKYVIFFMRSESSVHIIRILHGARDIGAIFLKEQ